MSNILDLPPKTIIQGTQFTAAWQFTTDHPSPGSYMDLSDWSGAFTVSDTIGSPALLTVIPTLSWTGDIVVRLTAAQTAALQIKNMIGGRGTAAYQLCLYAPDDDYDQVWQGALSIARRTAV